MLHISAIFMITAYGVSTCTKPLMIKMKSENCINLVLIHVFHLYSASLLSHWGSPDRCLCSLTLMWSVITIVVQPMSFCSSHRKLLLRYFPNCKKHIARIDSSFSGSPPACKTRCLASLSTYTGNLQTRKYNMIWCSTQLKVMTSMVVLKIGWLLLNSNCRK